ncbi:MAG: hypothetical protein HF976_01690 [ANME-2 cluster archaeon]|nr:hypothetical protein [ANME-2 cluster archaeon]MBC2700121.1 hypothetical protein [ANME-2 cluster archaeon]MBC2708781.1 hypothetical protein [ANME-2 cluster archaeon]MBC2748259.1 hypothetical protein [ANME-2 cluster archaeon]MBC2763098.1 hypothetical protein [ANME-2 cluster archaeon]
MPPDNKDKGRYDSMKITRIIGCLLILIMVQVSVADTDITVRPSVMVDYSVDPAYLMPGDEGTVTVTLNNAAKDYSYSVFVDNRTKEVFDLSAQVLDASLSGDSHIQVTSNSYYDVGLLGPGDTIEFAYSIKVSEDAPDSIRFLDFVFIGGGDMYDVKWKIPVTIDTSGIKLINSEVGRNSDFIVLDIANVRPNTVKAVTIVPVTDNVEFRPAQYFIGTMDSDEMFTIQFDIEPEDGVEQMGVKAVFKNGNNWHESDIQTINVNNSKPLIIVDKDSNPWLVFGIVGSMIAVIIIFFVVMRKRRSSREEI